MIDRRHELLRLAETIDCSVLHTADDPLEQVAILTDTKPSIMLADRGYRGAASTCGAWLIPSGHMRRLPVRLKCSPKRRQVAEPTIGRMKNDGLLARNWPGREIDDAPHAGCALPATTCGRSWCICGCFLATE